MPFPSPKDGETLNALGHILHFHKTAAAGDVPCTVFEMTAPPGASTPIHAHHREEESMYILEGELLMQRGETKTIGRPGSFWHFPKGEPHGYNNVSGRIARVLVIYSPGGFERFFPEAAKLGVPPDLAKMVALAGDLGAEILGPPPTP